MDILPLTGIIWAFGLATVILVGWHLRQKHRNKRLEIIHQERMKAMEKEIPLPEFPELDSGRSHGWTRRHELNPRWPLGFAALLVSTGAGACLALYLSGDPYHNQVWPLGLIAVFAGIGLALHYALLRGGRR
ncbi:MAG TPA: DUF6249 domain-containing protein [Acidobacteriota bacterium]|nr:DUF6249 domain-containing protein [Acidobacteriota bacterium]